MVKTRIVRGSTSRHNFTKRYGEILSFDSHKKKLFKAKYKQKTKLKRISFIDRVNINLGLDRVNK